MSLRPDPEPLPAPRLVDRGPVWPARALRVVVKEGPTDSLVIKTGTNSAAIIAVEREALVLSQVRHPNVVDLVRTGRRDGEASLITQFAGPLTLGDIHPRDAADVARLGASLLTVIGDIHTLGWSHGRILAEHCIVGTDGRLTLCAFGAAHRAEPRDPRRSADLAAAIVVIAELSDRLDPPADRAGRRRVRTLRRLLATTTSGPATPEAAERLRTELSDLSGSVALAAGSVGLAARSVALAEGPEQTITQPARGRRRSDETTTRPSTPKRPSRTRGLAVSASALVGLLATVAFLRWVGGPIGQSASQGVHRVGDLPEPLLLALNIMRVIAFAACLYGIILASALFAAVVTRRPDIERLATSMAPPRLRRVLVGLIGVGMLSSIATGPSATGPNSPSPSIGTMPTTHTTLASPATTTSATATTSMTDDTAVVVPDRVDIDRSSDTTDQPPDTATRAVPATPEIPSQLPNMWVIRSGDHLWGVATTALEAHLGRAASDTEVDGYWRRLVEMNRGSLVDADNPDLVYSGQVIELPALD